jgi:hypothetical protein
MLVKSSSFLIGSMWDAAAQQHVGRLRHHEVRLHFRDHRAQPSTKVESGPDGTQHFALTTVQAQKFAVTIIRRGDRYFWASRENRELKHVVIGIYHYFIDLQGGGYVKVEDQSLLSESMRDPGPSIRYLEQVTLGLGTLTYWGSAEQFSP